MPAIHHTDTNGRIDGWIIDHTIDGCAGRAADRGWYDLSVALSHMPEVPRGVTKLGKGWTMIAGEPGR